MDYPQTMRCNKPNKKYVESDGRCSGTAHHYKQSPFSADYRPERGPWYGCDRCACFAQHQDFKDNQNLAYDDLGVLVCKDTGKRLSD